MRNILRWLLAGVLRAARLNGPRPTLTSAGELERMYATVYSSTKQMFHQ